MSSRPPALGAESAADGRFRRQQSRFRDWVAEPEAGRYHLYVSWACPWAPRTIIGRRLKGLEDAIGMPVVDPLPAETGWAVPGGPRPDPGRERLGLPGRAVHRPGQRLPLPRPGLRRHRPRPPRAAQRAGA